MEIPWETLDELVLRRLIEEVVTRDGTDYGESERTLDQKVSEVKRALESRLAMIEWDPETETASIIKNN